MRITVQNLMPDLGLVGDMFHRTMSRIMARYCSAVLNEEGSGRPLLKTIGTVHIIPITQARLVRRP
jgi:hypothetical protein